MIEDERRVENDLETEWWPDIPGDTAFTVKVPAADPLVRDGCPAHVTVLYPFVHESRIDARACRELSELFAKHDAFTLTFAEFGRYPGVLYLDPRPHDPIKALTKDLTLHWPELVPYRGLFGAGLEPHLTVANHEGPATQDAAYDALQAELAPLLPLQCHVHAVQLVVWDGERWQDRATYRLARRPVERALTAGFGHRGDLDLDGPGERSPCGDEALPSRVQGGRGRVVPVEAGSDDQAGRR
ncbi:2'-5' RNA ligase family protein [Streptomyces chartreusis]